MANYFDYSQRTQDDPEQIGVGLGDNDGREYICVAGIAPPDSDTLDWVALTPECAKHLFELLKIVEHTFKDVHVPSRIPGGAEPDGWTGADGHLHASRDGTGPCVSWCDTCAEKSKQLSLLEENHDDAT